MALIERVKNICLTPDSEWNVIAAEPASPASLITTYVVPLVAIGAVAGFIGRSLLGVGMPFLGMFHFGLTSSLIMAVYGFVTAIISVAIVSILINVLAGTFNAQQNSSQAWKLAVYSFTPAWVAGVLQIGPMLGLLGVLAGLYGIYLMYLGLPRLMKCPPEKSVGYTLVVVIGAIVVNVLVGALGVTVMRLGRLPAAAIGRMMADQNRMMTPNPGEVNPQAAVQNLNSALSGARRVDPLNIETLKPFMPNTFAGLPKKSGNAQKSGIAGMMISRAEGLYSNGQKNIGLEITDNGGVAGLMAMAGWINMQEEKEDDNGFERTRKVDGRMVHEKQSKVEGNEYSIVLGERFTVTAKSHSVDLPTLESAVAALDLAKLESMKDVGVQK